jgi:hypothetical protein
MIRTVADLLQSLAKAEGERLANLDIKHAPTIGAMYEGLTENLLNRAMPKGADLRVVKGFVVNQNGQTSGQIDCMLVHGEGERIPYTDSYQWPVQNVLAVFEVKKSLFGSELADGYDQLRSVTEVYSGWVQAAQGEASMSIAPTERAYSEITGHILPPPDAWKTLPTNLNLIFHTVLTDQFAPVRILFGYEGYKTENGLREGLADHLEKFIGVFGHGPQGLPTLIVAGNYSLVKLSGHPYRAPLESDGSMPIMASGRANPLIFVLEQIWTRLSYRWPMTDLFGEDLHIENLARFLSARPSQVPDNPAQWGWQYRATPASEKLLASREDFQPWSPEVLTEAQFVIVHKLTQGIEVSMAEPSLREFVEKHGGTRESFVKGLIATRLIALNGDKLELTTSNCVTMILPNGDYIAADNNTGRLERWVSKWMSEYKHLTDGASE